MKRYLQGKRLGTHLLIPVIDTGPEQHRLSLIFQVGAQGGEETGGIDGSALEVELLDRAGTALEIVESPPPGPLKVRGSRSLQSMARYAFAPSSTEPATLKVTHGTNSVTFDFFLTFETRNRFETPPRVGDRYPFRRPPRSLLETLVYLLSDLVRLVYVFFRRLLCRHCCLKRFEAPLNSEDLGDEKYFEMEADFRSRGKCVCKCCRYMQFIRGYIVDFLGEVEVMLPDGPFDPQIYREDGIIDEFGPAQHGFYGDRGHPPQPHDHYLDEQADGCRYRGTDTPFVAPGDLAVYEFVGLVVDTCEGTVKGVKTWSVSWT